MSKQQRKQPLRQIITVKIALLIKTPMELEKAISLALDEGVDFVEVREEKSLHTVIRVVDGVVREFSSGNEYRISVRSLFEGGWGFGVASSLEDLEKAVKDSVKLAKLSSKWPERVEPEWPSFAGKFEAKSKKPPWEIGPEEKLNLIKEQDDQARRYERVRNRNVLYLDSLRDVRIMNSLGTSVSQRISRVRMSAQIYAYEGGITESAFESKAGAGGLEILEGLNLGEEAARRAIEALAAKPSPPGKFPSILDPRLAGVFIHEAFGHAAEGDSVLSDQSILTGKIGQSVGSDMVSVVDDPTWEGLYGSYRYDDEGSEAKKKYIVKDGVLTSFMTSLESAYRLKTRLTGNARSMSYDHPPLVRMSNTYIDRGDWTFEEMLSEIKEGIYAIGAVYGYTDPAKGQFMFKAEGGWLIKDGELKERLREVAIAGMTLEILHNVDAVGKDLEMDPGTCGKHGQFVPVTTGSPHIRVKELVFGGR